MKKKLSPVTINRYQTISKEIKPNSKILDVGCGQANLLQFLPDCEYVGVDMHESSIRKLKRKGIKAICLDVSKDSLPFENEFDFVIAGELLEHLTRPYDFLLQVKKALKKNGMLIGTTPNPYSLGKMLNVF